VRNAIRHKIATIGVEVVITTRGQFGKLITPMSPSGKTS